MVNTINKKSKYIHGLEIASLVILQIRGMYKATIYVQNMRNFEKKYYMENIN